MVLIGGGGGRPDSLLGYGDGGVLTNSGVRAALVLVGFVLLFFGAMVVVSYL